MTTRLLFTAALPGGSLLAGCVESGGTRSESMAPAPLSSEVKALEGMRERGWVNARYLK